MAYFHDVSSRVAFSEARQACEMDGGALLSIESSTEQRDIERLLQVRLTPGGGIADGDFWIGLTRVEGVDQTHSELSNALTSCPQLYQWTDGSVASFRNWYFDEPSCGGEACVVMYHQPTAPSGLGGAYLYQWNDDRCNMKHNFICKYDPGLNESDQKLIILMFVKCSLPEYQLTWISLRLRPRCPRAVFMVMIGKVAS
uniref:Chondrolectin n=1 Tax=Neolamprologus brichardi TaxID=32507 RepID=A0A3Q4HJQ2_NEOBR